MNIEGISNAHKHVEQRPIIHRLCDLRVSSPRVAQSLYLLVGNTVGVPGQSADEF
jgi:hypothetical protein